MTTRCDDGPEFEPDDPLVVILRPTHEYLAPPAGRYRAVRRAAARRRLLRATAGVGLSCAVAALIALPLLAARPRTPPPAPPLSPPTASSHPAHPSPSAPSDRPTARPSQRPSGDRSATPHGARTPGRAPSREPSALPTSSRRRPPVGRTRTLVPSGAPSRR